MKTLLRFETKRLISLYKTKHPTGISKRHWRSGENETEWKTKFRAQQLVTRSLNKSLATWCSENKTDVVIQIICTTFFVDM